MRVRGLHLGGVVASVALALGWCAGDRHLPDGQVPPGTARLQAVVGVTTEEAATSTTASPPRRFSLVAAGDVLLHSPLWRQAEADAAAGGRAGFDFRPLLSGVAQTVSSADLAICHLETPLAPPGGPYSSYPSFSVPPEIAPALAATGFDACSTASNHVFDRGAEGVDRTLATLDAAGLAHAGSARTPAEAGTTTLLRTEDATVALLSYTYGYNGIPAPRGEVWRSNTIDEGRILADARTARQRGADVVVVALHWGTEYQHEPDLQQSLLAPRLIRSPDVDLLLGHHAHVVQPIEVVDGEWVVYGMGNMIAHQGTLGPTKEEGLLVRFTFTETDTETETETEAETDTDSGSGSGSERHADGRDEDEGEAGWRVTAAEFSPLLAARGHAPVRLVEVGRVLTDPATDPALRPRLQEAWDRTTAIVAQRGATFAGLRPIAPLSARGR